MAEGVADRIIGLYSLGNSTREISDWLKENLGNRVSDETISSITDRVLPEIKVWRSRILDDVYSIVWINAIHYKVTDERVYRYPRNLQRLRHRQGRPQGFAWNVYL